MSTVTTQDIEASDAGLRAPVVEILREITRGGLAGLIVGLLVGGVGGRLVMRLAAILVPSSIGAHTENGNVIGDITLGGTAALILFGGLLTGAVAGSLWVMIAPWLPTAAGPRAAAAALITGALGTPALVQASNIDFIVLRRDPLVVASLIALVVLIGPSLVLVERWLDRRLPHATDPSAAAIAYALVTGLGTILTVFVVVPALLSSEIVVGGVALLLVGLGTLLTWVGRTRGGEPADPGLGLVVRGALVVAVVAGLWGSIAEVRGALLL